jgi:hypothetical protein
VPVPEIAPPHAVSSSAVDTGKREKQSALAATRLGVLGERTSSRTLLVARDESKHSLIIGVRSFSWNGVR